MKYVHTGLWVSVLITLGGCSSGEIGNGDGTFVTTGPTRSADGTCPYNVTRGDPNSWLLREPEMHFVYWGNYPENFKNTYQIVWDQLLNHDTVLQRLSEYGIRGGSLDVNHYDNNPNNVLPNADGGAPTSTLYTTDAGVQWTLLDDSQMTVEINNEIQGGLLPYPNDNTLYMIMFPSGTLTSGMLRDDAAGYHASGMYNGQKYAYGVIEYRGYDWNATDEIISHELGEAATDPDTSTGWRDYTPGHKSAEIGDICVWIPVSYGYSDYTVQKYWSQGACQCQ